MRSTGGMRPKMMGGNKASPALHVCRRHRHAAPAVRGVRRQLVVLVWGQRRPCSHLLGRIVGIGLISDLKGHLPVVKYPVTLSCKEISGVSASLDAQGDCAKWNVVLRGGKSCRRNRIGNQGNRGRRAAQLARSQGARGIEASGRTHRRRDRAPRSR